MAGDVPLATAEALLREVLRLDAPADAVVAAFFRRHRELGSRDRQRLGDMVFEILRRRTAWTRLAGDGQGPLERRLAELAWAGAAQAALAPTSVPGEVAGAGPGVDATDDAVHNLPAWLAQRLRAALGSDEAAFGQLAAALLEPAPLDLRVNTLKIKREALAAKLAADGVVCQATPYSPWGLRVQGKPALTRSAAFEAGEFEVQDEGSQLLALLVDARRGETVVDFCAGAGGKALALGMAMRNTGRLVAIDTSAQRLAALQPRAKRAGLDKLYAMAVAHERDARLQAYVGRADRVLVDAPCSGTGTLRRSPDIKWRLREPQVRELSRRQSDILAAASALVRPAGRLVYATCSLLDEENGEVANRFDEQLGREFVRVPAGEALAAARVVDAECLDDGGAMRLWPHRHASDGFFGAVWRRRS